MLASCMHDIIDIKRSPSLTVTPQALAWDGKHLWLSSRDLGTLYKLNVPEWKVVEELDPPGIIWAAVATDDGCRFTVGKGLNDDRYVYEFLDGKGFRKLFACPELTGSYLSFDGEHLYLSQWYKGLILQYDRQGKILRQIEVGEEICGHTFADGQLYVLRGRENKDVPGKSEEWRIVRVDLGARTPQLEELARVPFAARSLTFDGNRFWSNHRAANETVSFGLPA